MTGNRKRLAVLAILFVGAAACATGNEATPRRTKNAVVPTTADPTTAVGPDHELTVTTAYRPEAAQFGFRVAIERGMVFASAPGVAAQSEGTVFASSYSDGWSTPESVLSSWDWRFGRDLAVHNLNAVASSSESRSALFGNRSGTISVNAAPMNAGLINSFRLTGLYPQSSDDVGRAVAISDSYIAVSAPMSGYYSTPSPFVAIGPIENARASENVIAVNPGDVATSGSFGTSLAMNDTTLVVGAESTFSGKGSVFIYTRSGSDWTLAQRIDGAAGDAFGTDVALVGSRMIVGAPGVDKGAVYICDKAAGTWTCSIRVEYPNAAATGARAFGTSVALSTSGTEIAVGAPWAFGMSCCPGEAFTYELRDATWTLTRTLRPTTPTNADSFGLSVAIDGGVAVVGAPRGAGTVSIFGTPAADRRAPRPAVELDAPTAGSPLVSRVAIQGGAADGFIGSLTAWDRVGNRWDATGNASTGTFSGTWPNAERFYGSLTAYNANGYQLVPLSGSIAAPPATTATTLAPPVTTSPPSTEAAPAPTTPTTPATTPTIAPTVTRSPEVLPVTTAPIPASTTNKRPAGTSPTKTVPDKSSASQSTDAAQPKSTPTESTDSRVSNKPAPDATTLAAKCQVRRPCSVAVPALAGAARASTRGAPAGLTFNVGRSALSGTPRKAGTYKIVITGSRDGKSGSATVNLTVK